MRHARERNRRHNHAGTDVVEEAHGVLADPLRAEAEVLEGLLARVDAVERRLEAIEAREETLSDEVSSLSAQVGDIKMEVEDFQQY